jgi:hypothetical protein
MACIGDPWMLMKRTPMFSNAQPFSGPPLLPPAWQPRLPSHVVPFFTPDNSTYPLYPFSSQTPHPTPSPPSQAMPCTLAPLPQPIHLSIPGPACSMPPTLHHYFLRTTCAATCATSSFGASAKACKTFLPTPTTALSGLSQMSTSCRRHYLRYSSTVNSS